MSSKGRRYMSKRSRACDSCRAKKAACRIDSVPPCYLCILHGRNCTFLHPTNRPRILKDVQSNSPQSSRNQLDGSTSEILVPSTGNPSPFNMFKPMQDDLNDTTFDSTAGFEDPFGITDAGFPAYLGDALWTTGFTPGSLNYASSPADSVGPRLSEHRQGTVSPVDLENTHGLTPFLLGATSDMDPTLLQHYRYDMSGRFSFKELNIQSVGAQGYPTQFLFAPTSIFSTSLKENSHATSSVDDKRQELEAIVPADIGNRLISLFHTLAAPQYPIFSACDEITPLTTPPHLLASIYLLVESLAKFDERLCIDLAYEKPSSQALLKIINETLSGEIYSPTIATVQTLLLLCVRPHPDPIVQDIGLKWTYLSTMVSCAHSLGLHLDPSTWKITPLQIRLRRRLSCFIYHTDKWLALSLGRPPLLDPEKWLVTTIEAEDIFDSGFDSQTWSLILKESTLGSILDLTLHRLYTPRAISSTHDSPPRANATAEPLLQELSNWSQEFKSILSNRPSENTKQHRLIRIMQMHEQYVHLSIMKAKLRPYMQHTLDNNTVNEFRSVRAEMGICLDSAATLIHDLGPSDHEISWPSWSSTAFSSICFQILMMMISAIDAEEATYWFKCLQNLRRDIRLKADTLPCLRLGLLRIDSIFWKGIDRVFNLEDHVRQACSSNITDLG